MTIGPQDIVDTTVRLGADGDDLVLPFRTVKSGVMGRIVRLGPLVDEILARHAYPDAVSEVLGEAIALTALLGSTVKFQGKLTLQTKTDGPISMLVVDFSAPGAIRATASFDAGRVAAVVAEAGSDRRRRGAALIGAGHLAMTIDPGGDMDRYQGIVGIEDATLGEVADAYFRQSEQLPTFSRLAIARVYGPGPDGGRRGWHWRAGGLLIQHVAPDGGHQPPDTEDEDDLLAGEDDENWQRVRILGATVEDHELLDPTLPPDRLAYRLFHEEGVRASPALSLEAQCRCSPERVATFLSRFEEAELADLREADGALVVTCEFCASRYRFDTGGANSS